MALKEYTIRDFMRGERESVTIRFDSEDFVELPCWCEYDPALHTKNGNKVLLVRRVEVKDKDGSWSPYPSVSLLAEVEYEEQFMTRALIKKTNQEGFDIMRSMNDLPDTKLIQAARDANIYTCG